MSDSNPLAAWMRGDEPWPHHRPSTVEPAAHTGDSLDGGAPGADSAPRPPADADDPEVWPTPDDKPRGGRPRWWLAALALLPWLTIGVVAVALRGPSAPPQAGHADAFESAADPPGPAAPARTGGSPSTAVAEGQAADEPPASAPPPASGRPGSHAEADETMAIGAAAAQAVRLRHTFADLGPAEGTAGAGEETAPEGPDVARYVDLAVPESVRWHGDVAVVTVRAVVLDGRDGAWVGVRPARFAVPVRVVEAAPVVLSAPWALPVPDEPPAAPVWEPVADDGLLEAAGAALVAGGYHDPQELELARDPELPGVLHARLRALAAGEPAARKHEVWLAERPTPRLLGGDPPPTPVADDPAAEPTPVPDPERRRP